MISTDERRAAWLRKYATRREPWSGPVHAAPLLSKLSGRIVELGAGGGKVSESLPKEALALDWAALPAGRPRALADVRALPLRDASVDGIVAIHVLGHLLSTDRGATANECARVLRPGGALVVEVFASGDAREGAGREVEPATYEREGILTHYFDVDELGSMLAGAGLAGDISVEERRMRWGLRRALRGRFVRR